MTFNSLTFNPVESGGDFECPPKDSYVLELIQIGDFEEKPAFNNPDQINTQTRMTFKIVEFDYDSEYDDKDWNGEQVSDFYVFFKKDIPKDKVFNTWCHEKSKTFPMLTALLGHEPEPGEDIQLSELLGRRVKATVEPKESGYPKITSPLKHRQRKQKRAAAEPDPFTDDEAA